MLYYISECSWPIIIKVMNEINKHGDDELKYKWIDNIYISRQTKMFYYYRVDDQEFLIVKENNRKSGGVRLLLENGRKEYMNKSFIFEFKNMFDIKTTEIILALGLKKFPYNIYNKLK